MRVPRQFCTIDPTEARVEVPDDRFKELCSNWKPKSEVPAFLQVMDIAGLVKGASSGEGLGNAFLSHIAATDAIFHIIRVFEETADGDMATHVEGEVDPVRDLEIIAKELRLKDVAAVQKIIEPLKKEARRRPNAPRPSHAAGPSHTAGPLGPYGHAPRGAPGHMPPRPPSPSLSPPAERARARPAALRQVGRDGKAKEKKDRLEIITKVLDVLDTQDKDIRFESWNAKETEIINELHLLTAKPALYLVNMSEKDFIRKKNKWLPKLAAWLKENRPGEKMMPCAAYPAPPPPRSPAAPATTTFAASTTFRSPPPPRRYWHAGTRRRSSRSSSRWRATRKGPSTARRTRPSSRWAR